MDRKITSFTAANAIPVKIFRNVEVVEELIEDKHISPRHAQFIPTNKCNLNCSFCSCRKRNKGDEMSLADVTRVADELAYQGCKAVTITGGGEPLMHKGINEIVYEFYSRGIAVGLVTNGLLLDRLHPETFSMITWCRISCDDTRYGDEKTFDIIRKATQIGKKVDWAFSYVVRKDSNSENLNRYINFANVYGFTHVRVVSDLCELDGVPSMDAIKAKVLVNDSRVIYQGRKDYDRGQKNCWISLLKPVIGADGKIYPCCGVQYAHEAQDYDLPSSMCMGKVDDLDAIYAAQKPFDGRQCDRCYYKNYNDILEAMLEPMEHIPFV